MRLVKIYIGNSRITTKKQRGIPINKKRSIIDILREERNRIIQNDKIKIEKAEREGENKE